MTIRNTGSSLKDVSTSNRSNRKIGRDGKRRRKKNRRALLESLEGRRLLATGPTLVGIQADAGGLVNNLDILTTSPRELTFRFNEAASLDPASLSGIKIIRAGGDGQFESASATTDLGSEGAVRLEFQAVQPGSSGNGLELQFTKQFRLDTTLPIVTVNGNTINFELNSNPNLVTRASDIQFGINQNPEARNRVRVASLVGQSFFPVGQSTEDNFTVTLQGADVAQAVSSLGAPNVQVRFSAIERGVAGQDLQILVREAPLAQGATPIVSILNANQIEVLINSTAGSRTTVNEFVAALDNNPAARSTVKAELESGDGNLPIGPNINLISPISLATQSGGIDIELEPGFRGFGDSNREVVFRFAEDLPQDQYRIEIDGSSVAPLQNVLGEAFNNGIDQTILFELNLAPSIQAVVPQPVVNGQQRRDEVWVYFDRNDQLEAGSVRNTALYQLIPSEAGPNLQPTSVSYNPATGVAVLRFAQDLHALAGGGDVKQFHLRVGNIDMTGSAPIVISPDIEPGDSFALARDIANEWAVSPTNISSVVIDGAISKTEFINGFPVSNNEYLIDFPGGTDSPGVQEFRPEDPFDFIAPEADSFDGTTTVYYNFLGEFLGDDPTTPFFDTDKVYTNNITETQKERVREVLDLYSQYMGVQFVETPDLGFQIAVGDLTSGGATSGEGGFVFLPSTSLGLIDQRDVDEADDEIFGGGFSQAANAVINAFLGDVTAEVGPAGRVFPSPAEIVEAKFRFRPDSTDIDLYRFEVPVSGQITVEAVAERLKDRASILDSHLRLFRETGAGMVEVAANDDYWSEDSQIEVDLAAGTYYIGISASGNNNYDPMIEDSGIGGRSEGEYELRMSFTPNVGTTIVDETGLPLDGDSDGTPGGAYDFWFEAAAFNNNIFVKKDGGFITPTVAGAASAAPQAAVTSIPTAVAAATNLDRDIIRILPSGDGRVAITGNDSRPYLVDNEPYLIGFAPNGSTLEDGSTFQVPNDVTVMIDAGAIVKLRRARVGIGSSSPTTDFSGGALQVLGTPIVVGSGGSQVVIPGAPGETMPGTVVLTSLQDNSNDVNALGDTPPPPGFSDRPRPGDWGGLDYRSDVDKADESRINYEGDGVYLNVVQFADLRYGGGSILVETRPEVISPIELSETRSTIAYTTVQDSADSAIEASVDTFQETKHAFVAGQAVADVLRAGPDIHDVQLVNNSINGLFIRSRTRDGSGLEPLTTQARFDDLDVVHVVAENLQIEGTPGGALVETTAPPTRIVRLTAGVGGTLAAGEYRYKLSFVDAAGGESAISLPTRALTIDANQSITLSQLPAVPGDSNFVSRRLYRSVNDGPFRFVSVLSGSSTSFTDFGLQAGAAITTDGPSITGLTATVLQDGTLATGSYVYKISFVGNDGVESPLSNPTDAVDIVFGSDEQTILLDTLPVDNTIAARRIYRSVDGEPFRLIAQLDNASTSFEDDGKAAGPVKLELLRPRLDARLAIDAGLIIKSSGTFIQVEQGAQLLAEGTPNEQIIFTSLNDGRYGRGGSFQTNNVPETTVFQPGDWAGIYVGQGAQASFDNVRIAGGGGGARIDGKLAFFNPIEVHQGTLRLTNSRLEDSATGFVASDGNREGRGEHDQGVVFARGAQPVIAGNTFINNDASALNFDLNSLTGDYVSDHGRSIGEIDVIQGIDLGNQGPLIVDNTLESNAINGLEIRGGELEVAGVWDDTGIVHVVRDTISIPNHSVFGGLRVESQPNSSLVVKFDSTNAPATIIAGGDINGASDQFNGLDGRVGGALQLVGQPGKPVVLTSINDTTIGAGFDTQGVAQTDTNNLRGELPDDTGPRFPVGPEIPNGTIIDNDVPVDVAGHFTFGPVEIGRASCRERVYAPV